MNVQLAPALIIEELTEQNRQLDAQLENFQSVIAAVDAYRNEESLTGRAYQAHKDYFGEGHMPFIKAHRRLMHTHREANVRHMNQLRNMSHTNYDRNLMEKEVNQLRWSIRSTQAIHFLTIPTNILLERLIRIQQERRALLEHRLGELADYEMRTRSIYDGVETELKNVQRLLDRIQMQKKCDITGMVSLPTMGKVVLVSLKDENGNICRDSVEAMIKRGNLKDIELDALAEVFILLENCEEFTWFVGLLAVKIGPGSYMGPLEIHANRSHEEMKEFVLRNTLWTLDTELTTAIRDRVELRIADLLEQEWISKGSIHTDRLRLLQSSALLKVVDDLLMKFCSEAGHQTVIFGTKSCPGIMINQDDERNLRVQFSQMDKFVNLDGGSGPIGVHIPGSIGDRMHLTNYREREIVISPAFGFIGLRQPGDASNELLYRFYESISANYQFDPNDLVVNSALSIGVGFVPVIGDIAGIGGEVLNILNESTHIQEVKNNLSDLQDAASLSKFVYSNRLNVVFISENGVYESPQLWYSPNESICSRREEISVGHPQRD